MSCPRKRQALSQELSIASLRELNSYELTGEIRRGAPLDDMIFAHLATQAELRKLDAPEELICRMTVEGYTQREIACELGCSHQKVSRIIKQIRWSLYGVDVLPATRECAA